MGADGIGVVKAQREHALNVASGIWGPMTDPEMVWLSEQVKSGMKILEMGALHGKVTKLFAASGATVIVVDNATGEAGDERSRLYHQRQFEQNLSGELHNGTVVPFWMNTERFGREYADGFVFDLIWIDADHTYNALRHDIEMCVPLLRHNGLLCGHDYHWPDVSKAISNSVVGPDHWTVENGPITKTSPNKIWCWRKGDKPWLVA